MIIKKSINIDYWCLGIDSNNRNIFIANGYGDNEILTFDINNPTNPELVYEMDLDYFLRDVYIDNNYLYAIGDDGGLTIIDITNPYNLEIVSQYSIQGIFYDIKSFNNYLYIGTSSSGLIILDAHDKRNIKEFNRIYSENQGFKINIQKDLDMQILYLSEYGTETGFLKIFKIEEDGNLTLLSTIETSFYISNVDYYKDFIFVSDGDKGLKVYNIRNDKIYNPELIYTIPADTFTTDSYFDQYNNVLIVLDNSMGLKSYKIE